MKPIHDESELHERGQRIAALLPHLRDRPDKARSKAALIEYTRLLNQELDKAHSAPDMPSIYTIEGYEEMRHQEMIEAERKRY